MFFVDGTLTLYSINTHLDASTTEAFENIVEKGKIACNEQFLLFPQWSLLDQIQVIVSPFVHIFDIFLFAAEYWKSLKLAYEVKC